MKKLATYLLLFTALSFTLTAPNLPAAPAPAIADKASPTPHPAAKGDVLLDTLITEMERSVKQLKMDKVQEPFFIEYRVSDVDDLSAEAAFGALREDQHSRIRVLRVVVRIGDYKQDSYYQQGTGGATILPLDDNPVALRRQIWLLTDEVYKAAADAYAEKQAAMKQFSNDPNPVDDFAKAPPISAVEDIVVLNVNEKDWKEALQDATDLYKKYPDIQSLSSSLRFTAINDYLVNSEGTVARNGHATYSVNLNGATQAEDGMRLARNPYWAEGKVEDLPNHEALVKESAKMLDTLTALRKAPIVEESYRGPVLFAPDASTDVVFALVGSNILGRKPQLGRPNRTTGAFATSYKTRVLPKFVSVVDNPTMKEFGGKQLLGSYFVDSEGVKAQSVPVITAGTLENYLIGRQPIRDFTSSNGHGRAAPGGPPQPSVGTLILKSSEPASPEELKQQIMHMAKEANKDYGYRVETLGPGNAPRLLYRVYSSDGHEELVRGAVFNELDVRALRNDLVAAGNDPLVSNRVGNIPQTIIAPSLLFDELEVKRADTSKDKLPEYPAPPLAK